MTTELMIFVFLFIAVAIGAVISISMLCSADKENEELQKAFVAHEDIIREQWGTIEELEQKLAKKESLISILQTEIQEKENKK